MTRMASRAGTAVLVLAVACNSKKADNSAGTIIGVAGGTVALANGPSVQIPPNALSSDVQISIAAVAGSAPAGALSPVFKFGPDGITFALPVTVTFPVPAGTSAGTVYWTRAASGDYETVPTTFSGATATAHISHFSQGFAGAACSANASCTPASVCHTGAVSCAAGAPVCAASGNLPNGTSCGGTNVCAAGICGAPLAVAVAISPKTASVFAGGTATFTATVTGASNTAVSWTVQEGQTGGTVNAGVYTAPSAAGTYHVVATSVAESSKSDSATVTVTPPITVTISPKTTSVITGGTASFNASVTGATNRTVTWSVQQGAAGGSVTNGIYTAPSAAGTYNVVATSVVDPTKKDSATVTVTVPTAPPAAPTLQTTSVGCKKITLFVTAASDAASYVVKRDISPSGTFATTVSVAASAFPGVWLLVDTDVALADDTTYYYRIFAHNSAGDSASWATASAHTFGPPALVDPWGGATFLYAGDTQISMSWNPPAAAPASPTYAISRSATGAAGSYTAIKTDYPQTSFTDSGLTASTHYYYRVALQLAYVGGCPASADAVTGAAGSAIVQGPNAAASTVVIDTGTALVASTEPYDVAYNLGDPLVFSFSGTNWTEHPGMATADGRFTIPNVPAGFNIVNFNLGFRLYTDSRQFDVSPIQLGRSGVANATVATPLTATASNLAPWTTGVDHLEVFSLVNSDPNFLGHWLWMDTLPGATGIPAASATTASITADIFKQAALLEPSKGDVAYLHHLAHTAGTPYNYRSAQRSCVASYSGDMADGVARTVTCANGGAMTTAPTSVISMNWARSQFDALAKAAAPLGVTPTLAASVFEIDVVPDASRYRASGLNNDSPALVSVETDSAVTDFSESLTVPNHFSSGWSLLHQEDVSYNVPYTSPATTACPAPTASNYFVLVRQNGPVSELSSQIVPRVGIVSGVTVTRLAPIASTTNIGTGVPIQVSWTAPSGGVNQPTRYRVRRVPLGVDAGCKTTFASTISLYTTGNQTSVTYPPKFFTSGKSYLFEVRAMWSPDEEAGLVKPNQFFSSTRFAGTYKLTPVFTY